MQSSITKFTVINSNKHKQATFATRRHIHMNVLTRTAIISCKFSDVWQLYIPITKYSAYKIR